MELSKYFTKSEKAEIMRSQIHPAEYNPRTITDEGRKLLKRSIKQYGGVGVLFNLLLYLHSVSELIVNSLTESKV